MTSRVANISKILREKGKSLVNRIPEKFKEYGKATGLGVVFGTAIDTLLYQVACEYTALAQPSSVPNIPGIYVEPGMHYDDLIFLGMGATIIADGIRKKSVKQVVLGGVMILSGMLASQYQYGPL